MSDPDDLIPRRLPPSSAERLKTIAARTAGGNNAGATRWGRAVHPGSGASASRATEGSTLDWLSAYVGLAAAALTGSSFNIAAWDGSTQSGTSIGLNGDGSVGLLADGVYAVTAALYVPGAYTTPASAVINLSFNGGLNTTPGMFWRGGDAVAGFTPYVTSTVIEYTTGTALYGLLSYANLDATVTSVSATIDVVRISGRD